MLEVAAMIGKAIQQPGLTYVQDLKERTRRDLLDLNFSEHIIQLILEVADAMNAGHIQMLDHVRQITRLLHPMKSLSTRRYYTCISKEILTASCGDVSPRAKETKFITCYNY